jgi:hypothetical protein
LLAESNPGAVTRYYLRAVDQFARHFGKSPDKLGLEHLRTYQAYLLKHWKLAVATVVRQVAAPRFLSELNSKTACTTEVSRSSIDRTFSLVRAHMLRPMLIWWRIAGSTFWTGACSILCSGWCE